MDQPADPDKAGDEMGRSSDAADDQRDGRSR
jgi:hypothetical protein